MRTRTKATGIASIVLIVLGFFIIIMSIAIIKEQWKPEFMAGLGCGLGSIVLGVNTLLAWGGCCMYDMVKPEDRSSMYSGHRFGTRTLEQQPAVETGENDQASAEVVHTALSRFLEEEIAAQREGDLPTVCDKLKDKWHLPHDTYNMFDVALLARILHNTRMFNSVPDVAREMLKYTTDFKRWLHITPDFRRDLLNIRYNQKPDDYSPLGNIYVLLKAKSKNSNGQDYSPKSCIDPSNIPTVSGPNDAPQRAVPSDPSAPPLYEFGSGASARPSAPPDVAPPTYDEVVNTSVC